MIIAHQNRIVNNSIKFFARFFKNFWFFLPFSCSISEKSKDKNRQKPPQIAAKFPKTSESKQLSLSAEFLRTQRSVNRLLAGCKYDVMNKYKFFRQNIHRFSLSLFCIEKLSFPPLSDASDNTVTA